MRSVQSDHSGFQADFDAVYSQLKDTIGGHGFDGVTQETLLPLIMAAMRLVQRVAKSSGDGGQAKQQLVMALITQLIADSGLSKRDQISLQKVLEAFGPSIIDSLIAADHGQLLAHGWEKMRETCGCKKQ